MRTIQEIDREIRAIRKEMKAGGIRKVSCFNAGLSADERYYNQKLFALSAEKDRAHD